MSPRQDLTELLIVDTPPRPASADDLAARLREAEMGSSDDESDADGDSEDEDGGRAAAAAASAWAAKVREYTPERLREELSLIKEVVLGCMRGMREAHGARPPAPPARQRLSSRLAAFFLCEAAGSLF